MIATSKNQLVAAATGKPVVNETTPVSQTPYGQALINKLNGGTTPGIDYEQAMSLQGLGLSAPASQGLSAKGKYGGFYTAGDLETAITGAARTARSQSLDWASALNDLARKQMTDVYRSYGQQAASMNAQPMTAQEAFSTYTPEMRQAGILPEAVTSERAALESWRQQRQSEVEQAKQTTRDIEATPMARYARAIAENQYGVNPALAAGMFGPAYEAKMALENRDIASMDLTGLPYAEARQAEADKQAQADRAYTAEQRQTEATNKANTTAVEAATGLSASRMRNLTGMSDQSIYDAIVTQDGVPAEQQLTQFAVDKEKIIANFVNGNDKQKQAVLDALNAAMQNGQTRGKAEVMWSILRQYVATQGKGQTSISKDLLGMLQPVIDVSNYTQTP